MTFGDNEPTPIMNPVDDLAFVQSLRIFDFVNKITGASARKQANISWWIAFAIYGWNFIYFAHASDSVTVVFVTMGMIFLMICYQHIQKLLDLTEKLPEASIGVVLRWYSEVRRMRFLRTWFFLLFLVGAPASVFDLIVYHIISVEFAIPFFLHAMYVGIIPRDGTKKSLFSKATDKLKELAKAIQPAPKLIPLPLG